MIPRKCEKCGVWGHQKKDCKVLPAQNQGKTADSKFLQKQWKVKGKEVATEAAGSS
ncbi:hypothetical protein Dimus_024331, partial [Dionaea muscipula]